MEVNLTTSELAGLKTVAGYEGHVPTKWVETMPKPSGSMPIPIAESTS